MYVYMEVCIRMHAHDCFAPVTAYVHTYIHTYIHNTHIHIHIHTKKNIHSIHNTHTYMQTRTQCTPLFAAKHTARYILVKVVISCPYACRYAHTSAHTRFYIRVWAHKRTDGALYRRTWKPGNIEQGNACTCFCIKGPKLQVHTRAGEEIYYVGIIDFLTNYNAFKVSETAVKSLFYQKSQLSCVSHVLRLDFLCLLHSRQTTECAVRGMRMCTHDVQCVHIIH